MPKKKITVRASAADRWLKCAASATKFNTSEHPTEETNASANLGTLSHLMLERALENAVKKDGQKWENSNIKKIKSLMTPDDTKPFTDDDTTYAAKYALFAYNKIAQSHKKKDVELRTEQTVETNNTKNLKGLNVRGTLDVMVIEKNRLYVYDLKTGFIEVNAANNPQLEVYAHLAHNMFDGLDKNVEICIIQPSINSIEKDNVEIQDDFFEKVKEHIETQEYKTGGHCKFCPYNDVCPAMKRKVADFFNKIQNDELDLSRVENWSELLEMQKPIEKMFEKVRSQAIDYIESGGELPGWRLTSWNSKRQWTPEANVTKLKNVLGVSRDKVVEEKLRTPAQLEKLISKEKAYKMAEFTFQGKAKSLKKIN